MKTRLKLAGLIMAAVFLAPQISFGAEDQAKLLADKKAELNGHEWEMKLLPAADPKNGTPLTDTLVFKDMKFESKAMTEKGYKTTNYTISLQDGGPSVWETMQSADSGPSIFWRGEWEGESMKGVMSKQNADGKNEDYYFSSVSSKVVADTPKVEPSAVPAPAEDAAAAAPVVEEPKKVEAAAVPIVEAKKAEATQAVTKEQDKKKKKWF